ncbi:hypothetical protein XF35_04605 [Streptomyces platensis subsp. clarensis]|nr:hypothetical protein [Streptomyces platensis subsp. clarensis]
MTIQADLSDGYAAGGAPGPGAPPPGPAEPPATHPLYARLKPRYVPPRPAYAPRRAPVPVPPLRLSPMALLRVLGLGAVVIVALWLAQAEPRCGSMRCSPPWPTSPDCSRATESW